MSVASDEVTRQLYCVCIRFKASSFHDSHVLVATDVAARGLHIEQIDHIVHYGFPQSADSYVHRCGRTGRAGKTGTSVLLYVPAEAKRLNQLCQKLKRTATAIKDLKPDLLIEKKHKRRIELADLISRAESKKQSVIQEMH